MCSALLYLALPGLAWPCLALPCLALPCLALPCLALPCLALPCLALGERHGRDANTVIGLDGFSLEFLGWEMVIP